MFAGLGTSSSQEAKTYFSDLNRHRVQFTWSEDASVDDDLIDLAFSKGRADNRKQWLHEMNQPGNYIDYSTGIPLLFSPSI